MKKEQIKKMIQDLERELATPSTTPDRRGQISEEFRKLRTLLKSQ